MSLKYIEEKYKILCSVPSDIYEHLPTLFKYSSECDSVLECGVRRCVSSWAFAYGLLVNTSSSRKKLLLNDITQCNIDEILEKTKDTELIIYSKWVSNLEIVLENDYDLIFIDTWHVYGQLKRELAYLHKYAKKYIIMHDTEIDKIKSESIRNKHNIELKMKEFGFSREDVECGLQKAIDEFILEHSEWKIKEVFTNNNGLTILEKIL
jgi:hypothetical protein